MIVTRFGIAAGDAKPVFIDLLYPVTTLKPHAPTLTGKVLEKADANPVWRNSLTRAALGVRFPIRSVLAEPVVPLSLLMDLKPGDVIAITALRPTSFWSASASTDRTPLSQSSRRTTMFA